MISNWTSFDSNRRSCPLWSLLTKNEYWPFSPILPVDYRCGLSPTYHITITLPAVGTGAITCKVRSTVMPTSKYHSRVLVHSSLRRRIKAGFLNWPRNRFTSPGFLRTHCLLFATSLEGLNSLDIADFLVLMVSLRSRQILFRVLTVWNNWKSPLQIQTRSSARAKD